VSLRVFFQAEDEELLLSFPRLRHRHIFLVLPYPAFPFFGVSLDTTSYFLERSSQLAELVSLTVSSEGCVPVVSATPELTSLV